LQSFIEVPDDVDKLINDLFTFSLAEPSLCNKLQRRQVPEYDLAETLAGTSVFSPALFMGTPIQNCNEVPSFAKDIMNFCLQVEDGSITKLGGRPRNDYYDLADAISTNMLSPTSKMHKDTNSATEASSMRTSLTRNEMLFTEVPALPNEYSFKHDYIRQQTNYIHQAVTDLFSHQNF
jgi:hypothetical protein